MEYKNVAYRIEVLRNTMRKQILICDLVRYTKSDRYRMRCAGGNPLAASMMSWFSLVRAAATALAVAAKTHPAHVPGYATRVCTAVFAAASRMALSLLAETDDPLVADNALALLVDSGTGTVPPEEILAVLDAEYDGLYEPSVREATAQLALDQVLATGDRDQAAIWLERFQRNVTDRCTDVPTAPRFCDGYRAELAAADGQFAALLGSDLLTWQGALVAAAWRCHTQAPFEHESQAATGSWEDGWSWLD